MRVLIFAFFYLSSSQILYYEAFTSTNFITSEGWTLQNVFGIYSDCGANRILGGYNCFGARAQAMILLQLPPHYQIDITFEFWRIDSWDNEDFYVYLDQQKSLHQKYGVGGPQICGAGWGEYVYNIVINQPHIYQSVQVLLTSNLNGLPDDESWGIRDFHLYLHLCPAGCLSCESKDQRWECVPWVLLNSAFLAVTSGSFSNDGWIIISGTQSTSLCANIPLFGGYNLLGQNSEIKKTYDLPAHTILKIKFRFAFIDSWDNEYAYLYVDGKLCYQESYYYGADQIRDVCGSSFNDQFSNQQITISHSAAQVTLIFKTNIDETPNNESFGIRDIEIFTFFYNSICGNGIIENEEPCDDGNLYPYDGCFNCAYSCVEGCSNCILGQCWECDDRWNFETQNNNCIPLQNDEMIVQQEICDDVVSYEICKNGQFICDDNCQKCKFGICQSCKKNYVLLENKCFPICQDLIYVNDLQCFDDNLKAFDQCHQCYYDTELGCQEFENQQCIQCENGWNFDFQLKKCIPICGDNKISGEEQCDISKYSIQKYKHGCEMCLYNCQQECIQCDFGQCQECKLGWKLNNNYQCETICGDHLIQGIEDCDDQNQLKQDGCYECKNDCQVQCNECFRGKCYDCLQGWYLDDNQICQQQCGDNIIALLSNEECEDNNQFQNDGCFECKIECCEFCKTCIYGICYNCMPTFTLIDQYCVPICGDGQITIGFEQCDDMNEIPYDGCYECQYQCRKNCKLCIKGMCYDACEYGFHLINDDCVTVCGDGIVAGEENCEDNNNDISDGCYECQFLCPLNCQICDEGKCKQCDQGFDLIKEQNFCKAACGNGLVSDEEECDDQNKKDGDGCSKICKIEENYVCKNFEFSFSQCIYSKYPEFLVKFIEEKNQKQYVSLYFSEQVKTINKIAYSESIELFIIGFDPTIYKLNLIINQEALDYVQDVEYTVEIEFFSSMNTIPTLSVTLNNPLYNIDDAELLNYNGLVRLNLPKYIDDEKQKGAETLKSINQYMANSMGGVGILALILGNQLLLGSVLEVLQQQSYLRFINVVFPFNLFIYFESSNIISIQPILDHFQFQKILKLIDSQQYYVESYQKLKFYEINADIFTNIQGQILQIVLLSTSYLSCLIIIRLIESVPIMKLNNHFLALILNRTQKFSFAYIKQFNLEMLKVLLRANCWDILFTIFLQIKSSSKDNQVRSILGNLIAIFFLYSCLLIINLLVSKNSFEFKNFFQYWKSKNDLFTTLKKILFIAVLVVFQDNQMLQTILLSLISQFYLTYIIKFRPVNNRMEYFNLILMEGSAFIFTVTSIFYWSQMSEFIKYEKQVILGWFHIGMLLSVLVINLAIQVKEVALQTYDKVSQALCKRRVISNLKNDPYPLKSAVNSYPVENVMQQNL